MLYIYSASCRALLYFVVRTHYIKITQWLVFTHWLKAELGPVNHLQEIRSFMAGNNLILTTSKKPYMDVPFKTGLHLVWTVTYQNKIPDHFRMVLGSGCKFNVLCMRKQS